MRSYGNAALLAFSADQGSAAIFGAREALKMSESGNRVFRFRLIFGWDGQSIGVPLEEIQVVQRTFDTRNAFDTVCEHDLQGGLLTEFRSRGGHPEIRRWPTVGKELAETV
jgi:hypothetical protein